MTPEVSGKLHELVAAGATIVGPRPKASPSLAHYPDADSEVVEMANDLWGDMDGVTDTKHAFGKGMTCSGLALNEVLGRPERSTGFCFERSLESQPAWVHRLTANAAARHPMVTKNSESFCSRSAPAIRWSLRAGIAAPNY